MYKAKSFLFLTILSAIFATGCKSEQIPNENQQEKEQTQKNGENENSYNR